MPSFDVTIQGKKYHVEIPDPGASPLQVVVDGQTFDVAVSGTGVTAPRGEALRAMPAPAPQPTALPPLPRVAVAVPAAPAAPAPGGGHEVTAPMPGTLLSIDVKVGDAVSAGQVVCVLEAMKMKNPIRVNFDGVVSEVVAAPGQTVPFGAVLIRITN